MRALPSRITTDIAEQTTGVTCPDCPGVLEVTAENEHLRFQCRIGHAYSLYDLIQAKEQRLEDRLWAPVTALTELAALLREALASGKLAGRAATFEERAARATRHAAALRVLIQENAPTMLDPDQDTRRK